MEDLFFVWKNISSLEMGITVNSLPPYAKPRERVSSLAVPGRPGLLHMVEGDMVYDEIVKTCMCTFPKEWDPVHTKHWPTLAKGWLSGASDVEFSNELGYVRPARIDTQIDFDRIIQDTREFAIPFACYPFKKKTDWATHELTFASPAKGEDINVYDAPGFSIGPDLVFSLPRITIIGSGDVTFTLNGVTVYLYDLVYNAAGSIIIDSEMREAFLSNGGPANSIMGGPFPTLAAGENNFRWTGTGMVNAVKIIPRWRWV